MGNTKHAEQEDDDEADRKTFQTFVGKSQMGLAPRDIRPYTVTVYDLENLVMDRVIAALLGQAKANGGVLLHSHNASAENQAHFMKSKLGLTVADIEKSEATIIPRNSEVEYCVQYKDLLEDVISPLPSRGEGS